MIDDFIEEITVISDLGTEAIIDETAVKPWLDTHLLYKECSDYVINNGGWQIPRPSLYKMAARNGR